MTNAVTFQPRFMFDTEALIRLMGSAFDGGIGRRGEFTMSVLSVGELHREQARPESRIVGRSAIERLLGQMPALALPISAAAEYPAIVLAYEAAGVTITDVAAWVAAHALAANLVLLAEDPRVYRFVPRLHVGHWTADLASMSRRG